MKNLFWFLFLLLFLTGCNDNKPVNTDQPLSEISPEISGMSSERLALIDTMCIKAISDGEAPGIVALIARNGNVIYHKAFGVADNQSGRELKKDDIFRIASQTKAVTATAVMMLWEEGKFRLDDPVWWYIPEFKNPGILKDFNKRDSSYTTEPVKGQITIRQLLTHTSGIGYGAIDEDERFRMIYHKAGIIDAFSTANVSIEENIKKLAKMPLHHNPGEKFTYSEGLDVLGYFIEIISGMPLDVFMRTRLFEPLGMNDTWFYLPEDKAPRLVSVLMPDKEKWTTIPVTFFDAGYPVKGARRFFAGGAGLSSTAMDYALFLQMYLNGGELNGKRILSRTTIQFMMSNQNRTVWNEDSDNYYALAFSVTTKKGQDMGGQGNEGTFFWGGYFNTQYFADPKEKIIGILMKQTYGADKDKTGWKFPILTSQAVID